MKQIRLLAIVILLFSNAHTQHNDSACNEWKYKFSVGIWNPAIRGDLTANNLPGYINITLNDKFKSPDYFLSAEFEAGKDKLALFAQFNFVNLTGEGTFVNSSYLYSRSQVKAFFISAGLTFDFYSDRNLIFELFGGARWNYISSSIETHFVSDGSKRENENRSFIDPLTGLGFQYYPFKSGYLKNIFFKGHVDVGGFGLVSLLSSESYLCSGFVLYDDFSLQLGYRYIDVNYSAGDYIYNTGIQGFELSVAKSF